MLVCFMMKIHIGDQCNRNKFSRKWQMGSCYGPMDSVKLKSNGTYLSRCCLEPGVYTLICKNDVGPYGWGNSFLEIFGQKYCDDFVGYKGMREVIVAG